MEDLMIDPVAIKEAGRELRRTCWHHASDSHGCKVLHSIHIIIKSVTEHVCRGGIL